ncbi:SpoIIE family protein phosphatase [Bradyrhizobium tropiciagri]|uniref:ATP-binding SpoIIE family protein phosphatase n=1 Tax=Bradyrhizobium tropiciagri TaxID=312253 RepID=UPI001BA8A3BF|nr:ATP-binding SpoIIE family protein phosphatase [Bradyrhizobium tropiciagri]MBR0869014.1 SpoIIE family protein phosphatase [Bradyrhizobium tropiciagri]
MISLAVQDQSQVSETRRKATEMAQRQGFGDSDTGRVALVATELATNILKHGKGGEILVGPYGDGADSGIELIALDKGPGIHNVAACMADGYSTAGTPGKGLGAVSRQSHFVDVASWPGGGTAVLARLRPGQPNGSIDAAQIGAVSVPKPGEDVCGDSWGVAVGPEETTLLVADGLGHGPEAAEAAVEAVRLFHRFNGHRAPVLLEYIHGGLRATRGAAVSVARLQPAAGKVIYSGVGNVAGVIFGNGDLRRMVSMPGTAGHNVRKIQAFDYPFTAGLVILHSDGIVSSWTLERYTNLIARHPTLIAAVLYRDLTRHRDDSTVLVAKW